MLAIGYIFYCDDTDIITEKLYIFIMWFSLLTWVSLIFTLKFTFKNHCMTDVTESLICFTSYLNLYFILLYFFPTLFFFPNKRFLHCSPFDEYNLWKSQVDTGSEKGRERLNILTKSLLLRRTKDQLDSTGKPLVISLTRPWGRLGEEDDRVLVWVG